MPIESTGRRPELDAIRAVVVVGLVFFHASLVFDTDDDYYVKNAVTTTATTASAALGAVWAMPLLFLVAGLGAWHSLRNRGTGGFVRERLLRIGVPLAFVTVALDPVPQWLRLRGEHPEEDIDYWAFLGKFFSVRPDLADFPFVLDGDWFEFGHLWFLVLLLTFSLLLAAAVRWIPAARPAGWRDRAAEAVTSRPSALFAAAVPIALICAVFGLEEGFAAWHRWAYLLFFGYGFVLASDDRFRTAMRRTAAVASAAGLVLFAMGLAGFMIGGDDSRDAFVEMNPTAIAARTVFGAAGWCWLVAILGLLDRQRVRIRVTAGDGHASESATPAGGRAGQGSAQGSHARRGRRAYAYFGPAALPFYLLHQPVLVAVAYGVVGWELPAGLKYLVIVVASLALTMLIYDLFVRRTRVTRLLFGMRPARA
ncbi:acyltransferase [Yinghuangia sp. ASG 101]|uniref:acyltransferase family protein n=1 Tax=Yinghuangia sp. ASG 101 TaxID=2896848 RepID=UPI001E5F1CE8|nr:acyltransferase [Yinghuangia sp. ASG 101]UGQ09448.1 acyltransferase [Yinghuangia sp. ASG 101]